MYNLLDTICFNAVKQHICKIIRLELKKVNQLYFYNSCNRNNQLNSSLLLSTLNTRLRYDH